MLDVLLINPPIEYKFTTLRSRNEHLGLAYLVSFLRQKGLSVEVIDATFEDFDIEKTVNEILKIFPFEIIGFSVTERVFPETIEIINRLKRNNIGKRVVLGGQFPTLAHKEILRSFPQVDFVIRGEGEIPLFNLVNFIKGHQNNIDTIKGLAYRDGKEVKTIGEHFLIDDLNTLPYPARKYTNKIVSEKKRIPLSGSRGCPMNCGFCSVTEFYKKGGRVIIRHRSPENVVDEIQELIKNYGYRYFYFYDDEFTLSQDYAYGIALQIMKRKLKLKFLVNCRIDRIEEKLLLNLKKAGLDYVYSGIEAYSVAQLNRYQKKINQSMINKALKLLNKLDIKPVFGFIMFDPWTDMEAIKTNFDFLKRNKRYVILENLTSKLCLYYGTKLFTLAREQGIIRNPFDEVDYEIKDIKVEKLWQIICRYAVDSLKIRNELEELETASIIPLQREDLIYANHKKFYGIKRKLIDLSFLVFKKAISFIEEKNKIAADDIINFHNNHSLALLRPFWQIIKKQPTMQYPQM